MDIEEKKHFFNNWGRALAAWQMVEEAMFYSAHLALGVKPELSSMIFFHNKTADNKIGFLDKLIKCTLDSSRFQSRWVPLRKKIRTQCSARNELAHWAPLDLSVQGVPDGDWPRTKLGLSEHRYAVVGMGQTSVKAHDGVDLFMFEMHFTELASEIYRFNALNFDINNLQGAPFPPNIIELHERLLRTPESVLRLD